MDRKVKKVCSRCGFCCIKYKIVLLTEEEEWEGLFKMQKHPDFHYLIFSPPQDSHTRWSHMIVKTKKMWVSLLGKVDEVCCYFDGITSRCLIHSHKPQACKTFFCGKTKAAENTRKLALSEPPS